ncbi:hypothetical protein ACDP63_05420 [Paracoccus sp. P2]|uniref:Uncharacterized protein n=1 Tax=Paracoccus pantotrophus TaxID=82367 RepID=A0A1I5EE39_PARPN|nr:hypothetical protein [Paracoccus pantotrophus]MDF3853127.1 hypothetical protein [Paracoccus pantotrophus]QFG36965.1 hypothetical protein ESD82_12290 [Paracoccus pantotrophus]QLH14533.1 hypothetical protein HYQ43_09450 [Paracoccus pantotrophus]RDD98451.1 hypothetical protein DTW92_06110 [Paracoccus pantotrophus]RKS52621.1 hypothetical protein BDE18_1951 [Paracoccus pantotrophus]
MAKAVEGKAVEITAGNVDNNHIPVSPIRDLFPADSFGGGNKSEAGKPITVELHTVGSFETDIATGKWILRIRAKDAIGTFYKNINAKDGTRLFFEKIGPRDFRVSVIA